MHEVAPGIWLDDTTGQYYDAQGNPISGDALNSALSGSNDTSAASGTAGGDVYTPPGTIDPDPTHAGHYPTGTNPPWIAAGYPTFDAWSQAIGSQKAADEAYREGQIALQQKQINATTGASGAAVSAERIRAQNAMDIAKLQNDLATAKNAQEAQQAKAALDEKYAELALQQKQEGFNEFTKLSDIAANPRNFMQTFFLHRGQQPPADSAAYSNLPGGLASHLGAGTTPHPFDIGWPDNGMASPASPPAYTHPAGQLLKLPESSVGAPQYATPTFGVPPTDASGRTTGNVGIGNGMFGAGTALGVGEGGTPISLSDWALKNLNSPNLTQASTTTPMAKGGITPEPIMGVGAKSNPALFHALSQSPGHKYLLGEKGPEGVVPAHYLPKFLQSRQGKEALGTHPPMGGDLASGDANYGTSIGGMTSTYGDGGMVGAPQGASGGDLMAMFANGGPLGMPNRMEQAAMRDPLAGRTMDGGAMGLSGSITAFADGGAIGYVNGQAVDPSTVVFKDPSMAALAGYGSTTGTGTVGGLSGTGSTAGTASTTPHENPNTFFSGSSSGVATANPGQPTAPTSAPATNPVPTTQKTTADIAIINGVKVWAGGPYSGMPVASTPANAGDLTPYLSNPNTPDPTGRVTQSFPTTTPTTYATAAGQQPAPQQAQPGNPYNTTHTYAGNMSPYDQLARAGSIPPFLSRVFGQGAGNQAVGTNTPQMAYLPPGVPLVSRLAYDQMDPSEQQALLSYISSYGIDPTDYLAQVNQQVAPARRRQSISYTGQ